MSIEYTLTRNKETEESNLNISWTTKASYKHYGP